jgi:hypothetical protein
VLPLNAKLGLVLLSASLLAPVASATTITFGTGGTLGFTTGGVASVTANNAAGLTGLTVTVTAGSTTTCGTPGCTLDSAATGYGVINGTADTSAGIDGNGQIDTLTIGFNNTVRVTAITFGNWDNSDDAGIYNGTTLLTSFSSNTPTASLNSVGTSFQIRAVGNNDDFRIQSITFTEIPEPATFGMAGIAMLGLGFAARKKMRRS